jgi:hypothetical protein
LKFEDAKLLDHPLVARAFAVAEKWHRGQVRGTTSGRDAPYIRHPVRVAEILEATIEAYDPVLIAAGLTHDILEDVPEEQRAEAERDILEKLGPAVLKLVQEVTVDPALEGDVRRDFQETQIGQSSLNARRLKVADRLANLQSLTFDPPAHWNLSNIYKYYQSGVNLIHNADIKDPALVHLVDHTLEMADRAVFVAIRERVKQKGTSNKAWRGYPSSVDSYLRRAEQDIALKQKMISEDGQPIQHTSDLDALYADAALAQQELGAVITQLSTVVQCTPVVPPKLKQRDRAEEVIEKRFGGQAEKINDIARASVICNDMEDVRKVLLCLSKSYKIEQIYDRFKYPPMSCYRDMRLILRSDESHFCELQIHLDSFWKAKEFKGHAIYQRLRDLSSGGEMDSAQKKERRALYDESRALYKEAGAPHGFDKSKPESCVPESPDIVLERLGRYKEEYGNEGQTCHQNITIS